MMQHLSLALYRNGAIQKFLLTKTHFKFTYPQIFYGIHSENSENSLL